MSNPNVGMNFNPKENGASQKHFIKKFFVITEGSKNCSEDIHCQGR